jgi:DNA-binding IclR family transcriptional regulator
MTDDEPRTVDAVQRASDIIITLQELDGAGVTELADHLDVSKSGVHTQLTTLERNELVVKENGQYTLSLQFLDFGRYVRSRVNYYGIVEEEVEKLAQKTGEVAQFMVEEHGRGVYLHKARGENAIQTSSYVGDRNLLHCTALGKAILSELPNDYVEDVIDRHGLPRQTPNTIIDREELLEELERIRKQGVAYDREEILEGMQCIATSVITQNGDLLGAVSVTAPNSRMQQDRLENELADRVEHTANVIEINVTQTR